MMAYGGSAGNGGGAMGPSAGGGGGAGTTDVLGSTSDYSPQSTPTPLSASHSSAGVEAAAAVTSYGTGTTGTTSNYSPQDSPASSAGGATNNGQLPTFGFTQEQVACVCEVSRKQNLKSHRFSFC